MRVQLVLAEIAAVRGVGTIFRPRELLGPNDLVRDGELAGNAQGQLAVGVGIAGAFGRDGERPRPEDVMGGMGQVCAVGASAERDDDGAELRE